MPKNGKKQAVQKAQAAGLVAIEQATLRYSIYDEDAISSAEAALVDVGRKCQYNDDRGEREICRQLAEADAAIRTQDGVPDKWNAAILKQAGLKAFAQALGIGKSIPSGSRAR